MAVLVMGLGWCLVSSQGDVFAQPMGAQGSGSIHETPEEEAEEHAHNPRHGGYFGDADDIYHYELLLEGANRLVLYVNDELNAPLDTRDLEARWTLNPDASEPTAGRFTPSEDGATLLASLPASLLDDPVHVMVEVIKDGAWVGMEFFLPAPPPAR
jgi:hypothetical protein